MRVDDLTALMEKTEELHQDLKPYLTKGSFGMALNHPLVQEIPLFDLTRCALANARYQQKLKMLDAARTKKDWHSYIYLHERPYRFEALVRVASYGLPESALAPLIGAVWIDSENIWQHQKEWLKLWFDLKEPRATMDAEEQDAFGQLPDQLHIFRGVRKLNQRGLAWTLDESKAVWFANRYASPRPLVIEAVVQKDRVFAHFKGRGENEIVVDPRRTTIIRRRKP